MLSVLTVMETRIVTVLGIFFFILFFDRQCYVALMTEGFPPPLLVEYNNLRGVLSSSFGQEPQSCSPFFLMLFRSSLSAFIEKNNNKLVNSGLHVFLYFTAFLSIQKVIMYK